MMNEIQFKEGEKEAYNFLKGHSCHDICYEPNGTNTFPDFAVNGTTGVEVMSIHDELRQKTPVRQKFEQILAEANSEISSRRNETYFVCVEFPDDLKTISKQLGKCIKKNLLSVLDKEVIHGRYNDDDPHICVSGVKICLFSGTVRPGKVLILGSFEFGDKGVLATRYIAETIKDCIKKKQKKIPEHGYKTLWLILVADKAFEAMWSRRGSERQFVDKELECAIRPEGWNKILIIGKDLNELCSISRSCLTGDP